MKKIFEYVGLITLVLFSFYYTNKVVSMQNNKDPIMVSIKNYAQINNSKCNEGYITEEGVVLGASGFKVNTKLSYSAMKGVGYSTDLMVFEEQECILTKENNLNNYIIKGNESKKAVSIIVKVIDFKYLSNIVDICEKKDVTISVAVTGEQLENNKKYLNTLFNSNYDILYSGTSEDDFKKFLKILNSFNNKYQTFCLYNEVYNMIEICSKSYTNSIKTDKIFNNNLYLNIKSALESGDLIILNENKNIVFELSAIFNFLESKGLKIMKATDHIN